VKASGRQSLLFLKKKKQKNFIRLGSLYSRTHGSQEGEAIKPHHPKNPIPHPNPNSTDKVFLLLFVHKKKTLPAFHLPSFPTQAQP
jgi:hypothetical protein